MYGFHEFVEHLYDGYFDIFCQVIHMPLFILSFCRFILLLYLGHISLFLGIPWEFRLMSVHFKKTATSPSLYGLASYMNELVNWSSLISPTRDHRCFSSLSVTNYILSGHMHLNSHLEKFADLVFQEFIISYSLWHLSAVSQVLWSSSTPSKLVFVVIVLSNIQASRICHI